MLARQLQRRAGRNAAGAAEGFRHAARRPAFFRPCRPAAAGRGRRLGGTPTDGPGDFSAVLPVLPFFPVLLRFWEADDEFPAQLQFLWDRNSMRYLTYETSFYTHGAILDRLLEADM